MIKKSLIFLLTMLVMLPAYSNEFDTAMEKGYNIFMYIYSPRCKYCTKFMPIYRSLEKKHDGEFVFIKTDSTSDFGKEMMYEFKAGFVPYVVMINSNKHIAAPVSPDCILDKACIEKSMTHFRKVQ